MKKIITFLFFLASINVLAQNDTITKQDLIEELNPLKSNIEVLQKENNKLKSDINNLKTELNQKLQNTTLAIDSLQGLIQSNKDIIEQKAEELDLKIKDTNLSTNQKITDVDKSLNKNSLYGIIGLIAVILLSVLLFFFLKRRQKVNKTEVLEEINKTKTTVENDLIKEFEKQTNLIESQLEFLLQESKVNPINTNEKPDHSLILKVADQITSIERAISLMDKKAKGLQRIINSVTNLKHNLESKGYEIIEMLGVQVNPGMNIIVANSVVDDNLQKDDEIITRVIKPQVNYNDKMIQAAQVEVTVGY